MESFRFSVGVLGVRRLDSRSQCAVLLLPRVPIFVGLSGGWGMSIVTMVLSAFMSSIKVIVKSPRDTRINQTFL